MSIYFYILNSIPLLDLCVLGICCVIVISYLLDITALSEHYATTAITSAKHVYVTNKI